METKSICQGVYQFDFYEDLDVVTTGMIGVDPDGSVQCVILNINGKEVLIEGESADKIEKALKIRVESKMESIRLRDIQEAAIDKAESYVDDKYQMDLLDRKGA